MYGSNWSLAQRVRGVPWSAWVVPGRGVVCLLYQQPQTSGVGQACTATDRVLANGVFAAALVADADHADGAFGSGQRTKPGTRVVVGVVPDRARTVRVHTRGFPTASAPVRDNAFALRDETDAPPEAVTFAP